MLLSLSILPRSHSIFEALSSSHTVDAAACDKSVFFPEKYYTVFLGGEEVNGVVIYTNLNVYTQRAIKLVLYDNIINEMLISTVNGHVITSHHLPITIEGVGRAKSQL